jgi:regulator of protease activity HflC (stomatin/prohibitin superfamily)
MAPPLRSIGSDSGKSLVRRLVFAVALIAGSCVLLSSCLTRIDAAHVGIRVNFSGSNRGVDDIPTVTGWVPYNPLTEQIIMFPTSVQNVVWTKDPHEGSPHDESITFSSEEGVNVNADIGLSFHIEPRLAPRLYMRFRKNDLLDLADGYVRNSVREAFNVVASKMQVQDIYGAEKGRLEAEVRKRVQEQLGQDGFVIDQLTINGALRLPDTFLTAINRAMEQKQQSIQAQNRVAQVEAEARQAVAQAEGQAKAARLRAEGEAAARIITARAEARANLLLRRSMSPSMMQYRALEKWNGRLPVMNGGGQLPMLTFDTSKLAKEDDGDLAKLMKEIDAEDAAELKVKGEAAAADAAKDGAKDGAKDTAKDAPKDAPKPEDPKPEPPKK